jgi:hypothetical protein
MYFNLYVVIIQQFYAQKIIMSTLSVKIPSSLDERNKGSVDPILYRPP